ncbi:hypothetical protein BsWGS_26234 [Bradybaena similaris]
MCMCNSSYKIAATLLTCTMEKQRGSKGVLLLQDNACLHTAAHTLQTLRFEVLKHPAYSPDLATLDFNLFGPMNEHLRGQRCADDNEVMSAVQTWLLATPKSFYRRASTILWIGRLNVLQIATVF